MRLRLPRALRHPPERTERFLRRVDRLVVRVSSSSEVREYAFPLHGDRRFFLPLRGEGEREIAVQIWDRTRDGKPRRFPALTGRGRLTSDRRVTQVELDLNVPVSEY